MTTLFILIYLGISAYISGKESASASSKEEKVVLVIGFFMLGIPVKIADFLCYGFPMIWRKFVETRIGFQIDLRLLKSYDKMTEGQLDRLERWLIDDKKSDWFKKRCKVVLRRHGREVGE